MNDLLIAMALMKDEVEGLKEYHRAHNEVESPELKDMIANIIAVEKQHSQQLLNWVNSYAGPVLG